MSTLHIAEDRTHPALLVALVAVWLTVAILAGGLLIAQFGPVHIEGTALERALSTLLSANPALDVGPRS